MGFYTTIIALLAGFNAWLAGVGGKKLLRWCVVVYWTMVCIYWIWRTMEG